MRLTHIDLFSGIGGFALATGWAGFRTEVFCEIDKFCQEVLKARFGAIEDSKDIGLPCPNTQPKSTRTTTGTNSKNGAVADTESGRHLEQNEKIQTRGDAININPILIPDIRDFDGTRFRGSTLLTGGFPCQPFSCAGKRKGKEDNRYLWPEMLRVISEARPTWVVGENVAGIINMELEQVCLDLEGEGYEVQPVIIPACAVNAPHRRGRVWIVAYGTRDVPDGQDGPVRRGRGVGDVGQASSRRWETPWPEVATRLCRVDDGVPRRVDRLKALGNAIVPQVAYQIVKAIAEIETSEN